MKKLLAMLLSLVMLFTLVPFAFAEDAADYTLAIKGGDVNEHTEKVNGKYCLAVDVTLNGPTEDLLTSLTFDLRFDPQQLTYEDNQKADAFDMAVINDTEAGLLRCTIVSTNGVTVAEDTPVFTLYFVVNEELAAGTEIAFTLDDGATAEVDAFHPESHSVAANFAPFTVSEAKVFTGVVKFNEGEVAYKGATPYVIWDCVVRKHEPAFTVYEEDEETVISPENYDFEYKENELPGTGYLFVYFKNAYSGEAMLSFKIYLPGTTKTTVENVDDGILVTWDPVEDAAGYVIYRRAWSTTTGGWTAFARWDNTRELSYLDGHDSSHPVYAGTRYQYGVKAYFERRTDPIANAEIGGNVNEPSGNYNLGEVGPLKTTVRITTRTLTSVTPGTKKLTVKWAGSKNFTGYEVEYATNKTFTSGKKTVKISDAATYQTVIKNLTTGKTYYVHVRSYHEFEGMTYYGAWSNVLSGKVK